jgi:hypothetical protein
MAAPKCSVVDAEKCLLLDTYHQVKENHGNPASDGGYMDDISTPEAYWVKCS